MVDKIKHLLIGITGSPGAGKTFFAKELSAATGLRAIELNDIVKRCKLYKGKDSDGSLIVDIKALSLKTKELASKDSCIIVGHLLPELSIKLNLAIVLRISLKKLLSRLMKRRYSMEKIRENIIAEALDYCGEKAVQKGISKEVYEINALSKSQRREIIEYAKAVKSGKICKKPKKRIFNEMKELEELARKGKYGI